MDKNISGRHIAVIDQCILSAVGLGHLFAADPLGQYQLHLFNDFDTFETALSNIPFFSVIYSLSDGREERRNCLVYLRELALTHARIQRIILAANENEARLIGQFSPSRLHGVISKSVSLPELRQQLALLLGETTRVNDSTFNHCNRSQSRMLSPTERAILRYMSSGLSIPEIAARLDRNIKTIRAHKYNAMVKLGVSSDVGLLDAADILGHFPSREPLFTAPVPPLFS
ncbi:DNA-binding transcriptional activator BglJ [Lelliottia sp. CFBP8978]|jgi:luxR family transcriptional regulator, regulator of transport and utilization of aryl beta-glucosides|uniref:DNA-binding transcriptional activator BglJ n=1 Tax=Lelliottia sp. CFBP8978 TaxID=3096522 RepID=UPI002A6AC664|nr:DNA-binding transcriptional activator BglJ [Lelliottia sp. CFBP8978]MDY1037126.1 DNA-binding transcriptional activator BglJ [Lelliottia sp. CFBP8978]